MTFKLILWYLCSKSKGIHLPIIIIFKIISNMQDETSNYDDLLLYSDEEGEWCKVEGRKKNVKAEEQSQQTESSDESENEGNDNSDVWTRGIIANNGKPYDVIKEVVRTLVDFNKTRIDLEKASPFVLGWCPKTMTETILWIEEIIKKIIMVDASVSINNKNMVTIKGLMIRRQNTTLLNHTKLEARRRFVLVKMTNYKDRMKPQQGNQKSKVISERYSTKGKQGPHKN